MKNKGQGSLEMLVVFGILVLGVIIFGTFYINSHNKQTDIKKLDEEIGNAKDSLVITKEINPSSITCGNILCEPGETCSNCSSDCGACSLPPEPPPAEPGCGDGACNGTEVCDICVADCGVCTLPEPICKGEGTEKDPKQICTPEDLFNIRNNPNWYYVLNNDIDLDPAILKNESWYDTEKGWQPIGNDKAPFSGFLDGKNFKIYNLHINRKEENNIGLFGYAKDLEIKNILFWDTYPTGNNVVGGLLGKCETNCIISNVHMLIGTITGNSTLGGLVGEINNGMIDKSHTKIRITGLGEIQGGLAGLSRNSVISESYSAVQIEPIGQSSSIVGGLVGNLYNGSISNSYAIDNISGGSTIGGLVGKNDGGEISYCYSNAVVTGKEKTGGLVAQIFPEVKDTSNYWDIETSTQESSAMGIGYPMEDMKTQGIYKDWDFEKIWAIEKGYYPYLINNPLE